MLNLPLNGIPWHRSFLFIFCQKENVCISPRKLIQGLPWENLLSTFTIYRESFPFVVPFESDIEEDKSLPMMHAKWHRKVRKYVFIHFKWRGMAELKPSPSLVYQPDIVEVSGIVSAKNEKSSDPITGWTSFTLSMRSIDPATLKKCTCNIWSFTITG